MTDITVSQDGRGYHGPAMTAEIRNHNEQTVRSEVLKLRYGLGDGYTYTLEEVGRIFNVTRERVRQIEAKAIRKLQHPVRSRKLEGFVEGLTDSP